MKESMKQISEKDCFFLILCICAKDGIISQAELDVAFTEFNELASKEDNHFECLDEITYENIIDEFFESNLQLEDYLQILHKSIFLEEILKISKEAASADGFDIKENIAYSKAIEISS